MKKNYMIIVLLLFISGCVSKDLSIYEKEENTYKEICIQDEDSGGVITGKIIGRILVDILLLGLPEIDRAQLIYRVEARRKEIKYLNGFLGKPKSDIIAAYGPPNRSFTDGKNGEVYVWERFYTTGGDSTTYINNNGNSFGYNGARYGNNFAVANTYTSPIIQHRQSLTVSIDQDDNIYKWNRDDN